MVICAVLSTGGAALADPPPLAVLMAGPRCPDADTARVLAEGIRRHHKKKLLRSRVSREPALSRLARGFSSSQVASGLARARAAEALQRAKQLYTRTAFSGCVSLMSITEKMMAPHLGDLTPQVERRAFETMAQINLWLGICQWASGETRGAAAAFLRSAHLPASPRPDPEIFPPELIRAYEKAVATPQQEVSCQVDPRLSEKNMLIDGQPQLVVKGVMRLAAGVHYLTIHGRCAGGDPACETIKGQLGEAGVFSAHLDAASDGCQASLPRVAPASPLVCANVKEAEDPAFVASLTHALSAGGTLVTLLDQNKVSLRLQLGSQPAFTRQTVTRLEGHQSPAEIVTQSMDLLLQDSAPDGRPVVVQPIRQDWYRKWWVWAIVGGVITATTITTVAATSGSGNVQVVIGP